MSNDLTTAEASNRNDHISPIYKEIFMKSQFIDFNLFDQQFENLQTQAMDQQQNRDNFDQLVEIQSIHSTDSNHESDELNLLEMQRQAYVLWIKLGRCGSKQRQTTLKKQLSLMLKKIKTHQPYYNFINFRRQEIELLKLTQQIEQKIKSKQQQFKHLQQQRSKLQQEKEKRSLQIKQIREKQQLMQDIENLQKSMQELGKIREYFKQYRQNNKEFFNENMDFVNYIHKNFTKDQENLQNSLSQKDQQIQMIKNNIQLCKQNKKYLLQVLSQKHQQYAKVQKEYEQNYRNKLASQLNSRNSVVRFDAEQPNTSDQQIEELRYPHDTLQNQTGENRSSLRVIQTHKRRKQTLKSWLNRHYIFWFIAEFLIGILLLNWKTKP